MRDFWRYAMPDLRMNTARGHLAEFLVARAVGATHGRETLYNYLRTGTLAS